MIVQIRGTSGSGKSTAMRKVMKAIGGWEPIYKKGRRQPLYYQSGSVALLGHYESPCGGCDTIGSARQVYDTIQTLPHEVLLCEGLLLSEDTKWSSQLPDLRVVFLTTGLDTCLDRIGERRRASGNDKPLNPKNTTGRVRTIERARVKLENVGVCCRRASADQAPGLILGWLKLHAEPEGD